MSTLHIPITGYFLEDFHNRHQWYGAWQLFYYKSNYSSSRNPRHAVCHRSCSGQLKRITRCVSSRLAHLRCLQISIFLIRTVSRESVFVLLRIWASTYWNYQWKSGKQYTDKMFVPFRFSACGVTVTSSACKSVVVQTLKSIWFGHLCPRSSSGYEFKYWAHVWEMMNSVLRFWVIAFITLVYLLWRCIRYSYS